MDTFNKLRYIFSHRQKVNFIILVVIILVGSGFELLGIVAIMPLVTVVTDPGVIHTNSFYNHIYTYLNLKDDRQFVLLFVVSLILVYVIKNLYILFMYSCQYRFTFNNQRRTSMRLMRCYMTQPYIFHLSKNVSELQRNMRDDIAMLFAAVLGFVQLFSEGITSTALAIYLIIIDKSISIGVIVLLSVFSYTYIRFTKRRTKHLGDMSRDVAVSMNIWIRQSFEGIKEIKITNREQSYINNVDKTYLKSSEISRKQNLISNAPRPLFEAVCISAMLIVVGLKILKGVNLQYFIPVLSAFVVAAFRLLPSFSRLAYNINIINYNKAAIDNVYKDLKEVEQLEKNSKGRSKHQDILIPFNNSIDIHDITFSYPNVNKLVLNNASISIKHNSSVAFIGASGSGKTTLADIILGLLEPQGGQVISDGVSIFDSLYSWHKLLGYIPQSIYLIDDTIRNNILFGIPDDEADEDKIWKALESAQLVDFVKGLSQGIDTVVGERGIRLSGGQRQRIGIARALYNNPEILVLDEATSALDNDTETAVMEAIDKLHGSRTLIIIAHRLTTIRNCDEIYEVINGKIIKKDKRELFNL